MQEPNDQADDPAEGPPRESSRRRSPFSGSTLVWILVISGIVVVGRVTPFAPVRDFFGSFSWLTEQAIKITKDLFESYGYLTVFLAPLLENTLFLGALIPGTLVILLAGIAGTTTGMVRAGRAEATAANEAQKAKRDRDIAQATNDFLKRPFWTDSSHGSSHALKMVQPANGSEGRTFPS